MLIETVAKQPFSFQVVPFDSPRNHITIHVRLFISLLGELILCFITLSGVFIIDHCVAIYGSRAAPCVKLEMTSAMASFRDLSRSSLYRSRSYMRP